MSNACQSVKTGSVVKIKGARAFVKFEKTMECNGCKACMFATSKKEIVMPAKSIDGVKKGDTVSVEFPSARPSHAWLILFALPLFTFILGVIVAYLCDFSDGMTAVCSLVGLLFGLLAVFILEKAYFSQKYLAKIIKIIDENQQGE